MSNNKPKKVMNWAGYTMLLLILAMIIAVGYDTGVIPAIVENIE